MGAWVGSAGLVLDGKGALVGIVVGSGVGGKAEVADGTIGAVVGGAGLLPDDWVGGMGVRVAMNGTMVRVGVLEGNWVEVGGLDGWVDAAGEVLVGLGR